MIPLHTTATSNPRQLLFVVPAGNLPPRGLVREAPDRLAEWLRCGVIEEVVIGDTGVLITVSNGHAWRDVGDGIRDALVEALSESGWQIDPFTDSDDRLAGIVRELLDGPIGAYAQSHGGTIELVSVSGHHVAVRLSGACRGCPAAGSTLTDRLQHELRRRVGDHVTVVRDDASPPLALGKKLLSLLIR
jgi:Fe-S cluster biogenesis protein NfuA